MAQKARRGRPPSERLLGKTEQANSLSRLMRTWREDRGLTGRQVFTALTADHFRDGQVPKQTAFYRMLKGADLSWEFIEALADVCSDSLEEQQARSAQARVLWDAHLAEPAPVADPTTTEVVLLQRQLISSQEELLRVRGLYTATKEALVAADRKVVELTVLVAQLESQVTMLKQHQVELLVQKEPDSAQVGQTKQQLENTDRQRAVAAVQLDRAQIERDRALKLTTRATLHTAELQEKVMELRAVSGREVSDELTEPLPSLIAGRPAMLPAFAMTDDVPAALADITEDLDAAAHRLDEVAEQLGRGERDDPGTEAAGVVEAVDAQVVVDSTDDPGTSGSWGEPAGTPRDQPGPLPQPQHRSTSDFFANNANKRLNPGAIMRLADVARRDPRVVEELETSIRAAVYSFDANEVLHTAELLQRVKDESHSLELLRHELFTAGRALPSRFWTH